MEQRDPLTLVLCAAMSGTAFTGFAFTPLGGVVLGSPGALGRLLAPLYLS